MATIDTEGFSSESRLSTCWVFGSEMTACFFKKERFACIRRCYTDCGGSSRRFLSEVERADHYPPVVTPSTKK
jgi:hypothetical protein